MIMQPDVIIHVFLYYSLHQRENFYLDICSIERRSAD